MHRRSRFLVGLATAAITFGCLWFTVGAPHFNRGRKLCHPMHHHCIMKEEMENDACCGQSEGQKNEKVIVIKEVIKTDSVKK